MSPRPYSEAHGRRRGLNTKDLVRLVYPELRTLLHEYVFAAYFGDPTRSTIYEDDTIELPGQSVDPAPYFLTRVRSVDPWWYLLDYHSEERRRTAPRSTDQLLDFLQALYEAASIVNADEEEPSDEAVRRGQARMRELIDPALGLLEPALRLGGDGSIVQRTPTALEPLIEHPFPSEIAAEDIADDVRAAIAQFRGRDASSTDRHSACVRLAGVLEALRESEATKTALFTADENRLFEIANQFALRHRDSKQHGDYDEDIFLEWVFYCQLAAIRLTARVRARAE